MIRVSLAFVAAHELFKEIAPHVTRVASVYDPNT
jgi:hypothetical protein